MRTPKCAGRCGGARGVLPGNTFLARRSPPAGPQYLTFSPRAKPTQRRRPSAARATPRCSPTGAGWSALNAPLRANAPAPWRSSSASCRDAGGTSYARQTGSTSPRLLPSQTSTGRTGVFARRLRRPVRPRVARVAVPQCPGHQGPSEVKTPLDIYLQRHSPLSPDLGLHYSQARLSARYISRHVPGAGISLYPVSSYLSKWIKPGAK